MAHFPLSLPFISRINYFDRFAESGMYIIFISTQTADTVWEKIQKYIERDGVCEKDEKTMKRTKTETAWFLLASPSFSSLKAIWCTAKLNIAYSITAIKTSVSSFISTNDCMVLCWMEDGFQLISHRPAQTDRVMELYPHGHPVKEIPFLNCTASVQHHQHTIKHPLTKCLVENSRNRRKMQHNHFYLQWSHIGLIFISSWPQRKYCGVGGWRGGGGHYSVTTQSAACTSDSPPSGSTMHAWLLDLTQSTNVRGSALTG